MKQNNQVRTSGFSADPCISEILLGYYDDRWCKHTQDGLNQSRPVALVALGLSSHNHIGSDTTDCR